MDYIITTQRLGLRKWMDTDGIPFAEMNKDPQVMQYFPKTLTCEETAAAMQRINAHFDTHGFGLFAVDLRISGEFIGFTGFVVPAFKSFFTPCVEIGWRLRKKDWGKGYATEAATACLLYGFEALSFNRIYSFTSQLNLRSEKVMQKIGMLKEGEFDHPAIPIENALCRHVLYKVEHNAPGRVGASGAV